VKNELVVCFGYSRWGQWRQDHEIALRLARRNTVLYVETQRPRRERAHAHTPALRWVHDRLAVVGVPPRLPYGGFIPAAPARNAIAHASIMLSKKRVLRAVRSALKMFDSSPTVTLFFDPFDLPLAGKLGEQVSCYRVYDELAMLPSLRQIRGAIDRIEHEWLPRIDFVFASSRFQYQRRVKINGDTYFVPNACDFNRYHGALTCRWPLPDDLESVAAPRIGFVGGIDYRLDFDLLRFVARTRPDWSLVLLGPVKDTAASPAAALGSLRNVHFLGNKRPEQLPGYLRHLDASIIPYQLTEATETMYPWKVHEHLAAGKPVVSTPLPELEPLRGVVALAGPPVAFVEALDDEIEHNSEQRLQERVKVASANSWDERVEQMCGLIDQRLATRRRRGTPSARAPRLAPNSSIAAVHCW